MRHATSALLALAAGAVALIATACQDEPYCFTGCDDAGLGGEGGSPAPTGGRLGTGGNIIATGGSAGGGGCDADVATDVNNCGACDHRCELPGAFAACEAGRCVIDSCAAGSYDVDGEAETGCEYACPAPEPGPEICDGIDNDCDSFVDSLDVDLTPPPDLCTTTPNTPCADAEALCNGETGWSCVYGAEVEVDQGYIRTSETLCDGIDGNCDGVPDESFGLLGTPCDDGDPTTFGVCKDYGVIACDPADATSTRCDLSVLPDPVAPSTELCNGLDDDCDDDTDEDIAFDMAPVPGSSAVVDRYEASRYDASATAAGVQSSIACARAGVVPWTGAPFAEAKAACEARGAGYRLCSAAELRATCEAGAAQRYPYGADYDANACNGLDYDAIGTDVLVPTGSLADCATPDPDSGDSVDPRVFDLSGNAAEWTSTKTGETNTDPVRDIYQLHGGSYLSPEEGLACSIALAPRAGENAVLYNVGFRCCRDP